MAPVIWGLDLKEIQWGKFKSSYMWCNRYHLRRTKFIVYQLAMILCVVSESLGTDALSKYNKEQKSIESKSASMGHKISVKNDDIVGEFSYNIFTGVFVATIFGAAFFFDLFWPERQESRAVRIAWRVNAVLACCFTLASAIVLTVLISSRQAIFTGDATNLQLKLSPPLLYKKNGEAVASLVFLWLGLIATIASTLLMFKSINDIEQHGPFSGHVRREQQSDQPFAEHKNPVYATPRASSVKEESSNV